MDQLTIPNKLYGRDRDITKLLESFKRISKGHGEVLLVPGQSGVGKTALVHELEKPTRDSNGFFIKGKFDQYQQNIPYFAIRQALAKLCQELQSGNSKQRLRFKSDILQAVGNLGQVLVEFVPEFESFLGAQPPLIDISPQEARLRFAEVFRNFLEVICLPEHPLVLFIDDWQWADTASFELLKQMQVGITLRYLLVIVSYRDNEVGPGHPLMSTVEDLRSRIVPVEVLQVKNITVNDVQEIVVDTLKPAAEDVEGLAAIIHRKTLGNPFFVRSFLSFLHDFNLIWFEKSQNCWRWRIDKIDGVELPDTVVELFAMKLRRLDTDTQNLFSLAACLGNRFDMETLSIISGRNPKECKTLLFSENGKDMLLPLEVIGSNSPSEDFHTHMAFFRHDRVQQAAYTLMESEELPNILLKIGRILLTRLHPQQLEQRLFEVVNDLNAGYDLIHDKAEQLKVFELNITAARKAYADTAYHSALQFYQAADRFLQTPDFTEHLWHAQHELTMSFFKERAICEFLEGNSREAENCIQQSLAHARTALEKADVITILIVNYTLQARYPEAITAGRQALAALGVSLADADYEEACNNQIALVRQELGSRTVSSLVELPAMSNPEMLMASKILITMGPPCYRSHQRLWSVIVPKVVNLTLRYGNIPQIGYSHTAFGGLLGWVENDYTTAKEFGELASRLMTNTFRSPSDQSVFYLMIGSSIRHWFKHLKYSTQDYIDAYEIGLRSGNLQYAAYAFGHNMYCRFYQGVQLSTLIQESQNSLEFSQTHLNQWAIDLFEGGLNIFGKLSNESASLNGGDTFSEEKYLRSIRDHDNIQVTCIYKVLKTFSLLLSGKYEDALVLSNESEPLIYTVGTQGLLPWAEHVFARLLILTSLYSNTDEKQQSEWRTELDLIMNRLRIWADNCPENFEHKYLFAVAELARIDGKSVEAIQYYDKAVEAAQTGNFLQWEGMANERAYSFWLEQGNEHIAYVYFQQAYVCYNRWGAAAKVYSMETAYRTYLAKISPDGHGSGKPDEMLEREIKNVVVEKQIKHLRHYAIQMQQTKMRIEATTQAEELAQALQRLRVEIAERKLAEEALRASEVRFKTIFNEAPLGIALIDSLTGQVYSVNPMFAKIAGRTVEEMAHLDWMKITHPDDIQEDLDNMALLNAGKISGFKMEKRYLHPNGTPVWINMTIAPTYVEDKAHPRHLCMIEDITERKRTELIIEQQNEKLQELNVTKDKFFSIIAHDLRSPFQGFLNMTELMSEKTDEFTTEELATYTSGMNKSAENLYTLLQNLLEWAQMQNGVMDFSPNDFILKKIVVANIEPLNESAKRKGITIINEVAEEQKVFGDERMINSIINNLLSNAVKFTKKDGTVVIKSKKIDDETVEISVQDTGMGMSESTINKLFKVGEDIGRKGTDGEPSTGLGLLLCKEFVEKHGGKIWAESKENIGSTFSFTISKANTHDT